ncbi:hypothetical protein KM043_018404 [Ampulex compressa]|nr:hypothetical protein KM043_018404 [Ampulex compressa]
MMGFQQSAHATNNEHGSLESRIRILPSPRSIASLREFFGTKLRKPSDRDNRVCREIPLDYVDCPWLGDTVAFLNADGDIKLGTLQPNLGISAKIGEELYKTVSRKIRIVIRNA